MTKFTRQQITDEVEQIASGSLNIKNSKVYEVWAECMDQSFESNSLIFYKSGFRGFDERSAMDIILDLDINGHVSDSLTKEEIITFIKQRKID